MRTAASLGTWRKDKEQLNLAGRLATDRRTPSSGPRPRPESCHLDLEIEDVPRRDLATEANLVDAAEQWQLARKTIISQHGRSAQLRYRLDHEDARQCRPAGEVAGEESLVTGEVPPPSRTLCGH